MASLHNEPIDMYFSFFMEDYHEGTIIFKGIPIFPLNNYTDRELICLIDAGRIIKDYKIIRDEERHEIRVYIEPYSLKEIRKVESLWEYKYGGISE